MKNLEVPNVLLNGNHEKVSEWKLKKSIEITKKVRPDLFKIYKKKLKEKNEYFRKIRKDQLENLSLTKSLQSLTQVIP